MFKLLQNEMYVLESFIKNNQCILILFGGITSYSQILLSSPQAQEVGDLKIRKK